MPPGGYQPRRDPDSPWEDQPLYMDVGHSGGGHLGGVGTGGDDGDFSGGIVNLDLVENTRMDEAEVSMKSLVIWPLIALALVVMYSYRPSSSTTTEPAQAQPVVATTLQAVQPQPQQVNLNPPPPFAGSTERGHWLWIPDKNPGPPGYSIPPAPPNH